MTFTTAMAQSFDVLCRVKLRILEFVPGPPSSSEASVCWSSGVVERQQCIEAARAQVDCHLVTGGAPEEPGVKEAAVTEGAVEDAEIGEPRLAARDEVSYTLMLTG